MEKYAGRFAVPHRHAIGIARSDRALGEAAEKPPLSRHPRRIFLVGLPVQIDRADRQIGIAQMKKAKPEQHLLTAFEAQLGRHGEIDRAPAGAQLRRREVGPGLLHAACRRQTPSPELTPPAGRDDFYPYDRLRRHARSPNGAIKIEAVIPLRQLQEWPPAV